METSSLSGENVEQVRQFSASDSPQGADPFAEQPFILLARSILLAIESGQLDPDKAGSGVSYGERALRRVSSWGSGLKSTNRGGKCC